MSARRPLSDRIAELKANGPKPVNYERIEPKAWSPADATIDQVHPLRGRVIVEPLAEVQSSILFLPSQGRTTERSVAIGLVVALGPPMFKKGGIRCAICSGEGEVLVRYAGTSGPDFKAKCGPCYGSGRIPFEVPHDFEVGDVILHTGQHRSRDVELADGVYRSVAQEEVQAVVEGELGSVDVAHGGKPDYRTVIR